MLKRRQHCSAEHCRQGSPTLSEQSPPSQPQPGLLHSRSQRLSPLLASQAALGHRGSSGASGAAAGTSQRCPAQPGTHAQRKKGANGSGRQEPPWRQGEATQLALVAPGGDSREPLQAGPDSPGGQAQRGPRTVSWHGTPTGHCSSRQERATRSQRGPEKGWGWIGGREKKEKKKAWGQSWRGGRRKREKREIGEDGGQDLGTLEPPMLPGPTKPPPLQVISRFPRNPLLFHLFSPEATPSHEAMLPLVSQRPK